MFNINSCRRNTTATKRNQHVIWAIIVFTLVITSSIFRAIIIANLDLTPDEAFYAQWARKLDLSYYDHPPMVAYIIAFFTYLFGTHEASVRIFPYLSFIVICILLYKTSYLISLNHAVAFLSVIIILSIPASLALGTIMTPDIPLALCWTIATYYFCKICNQYQPKFKSVFSSPYLSPTSSNLQHQLVFKSQLINHFQSNSLYKNDLPPLNICHQYNNTNFSTSFDEFYETIIWGIVGLFLGLGAMSKYTMIFIVPPIAFTIISFKPLREKILSFRFILMILLAALGSFPVIFWNYINDWISLKFQFKHGFESREIEIWRNLGEFLLGQLLTIGPTLFFAFLIYPTLNLYNFYKNKDLGRFFLSFSGIFTLFFFLANSTRSKIEANWPQFAYISLIPIIAEYIINSRKIYKYFLVLIFPSFILTNLYFMHTNTSLIPIPAKADPTSKLYGWKELGYYLKKIDIETCRKAIFIVQGAPLAGIVAYYGDIPLTRVAEANGKGQWGMWWRGRKIEVGSTIVYVDENKYSEVDAFKKRFEISRKLDPIIITRYGRHIRTINITILEKSKEQIIFD